MMSLSVDRLRPLERVSKNRRGEETSGRCFSRAKTVSALSRRQTNGGGAGRFGSRPSQASDRVAGSSLSPGQQDDGGASTIGRVTLVQHNRSARAGRHG